LLLLIAPASDRLLIVAAYLIAAIGTGLGGPTFMISYQNDLGRKQMGAGIGLFSLSRQFGASVSTALAGAIVGAGAAEATAATSASVTVDLAVATAVQQAFLLPTLAGAAVVACALFLPKRPLRVSHHEPDDPAAAVVPPSPAAVMH
jgi:hypothetical protein